MFEELDLRIDNVGPDVKPSPTPPPPTNACFTIIKCTVQSAGVIACIPIH